MTVSMGSEFAPLFDARSLAWSGPAGARRASGASSGLIAIELTAECLGMAAAKLRHAGRQGFAAGDANGFDKGFR